MKKRIFLLPLLLAAVLSLVGCGWGDDFDLTFVVPAGNVDGVVYIDGGIIPQSKTLRVIPAADTPEGTLRLESIYAEDADVYDGTFPLAAETPLKLAVEKGGCFRLGVSVPNPTDEDITVTLTVKNVILIVTCS